MKALVFKIFKEFRTESTVYLGCTHIDRNVLTCIRVLNIMKDDI